MQLLEVTLKCSSPRGAAGKLTPTRGRRRVSRLGWADAFVIFLSFVAGAGMSVCQGHCLAACLRPRLFKVASLPLLTSDVTPPLGMLDLRLSDFDGTSRRDEGRAASTYLPPPVPVPPSPSPPPLPCSRGFLLLWCECAKSKGSIFRFLVFCLALMLSSGDVSV